MMSLKLTLATDDGFVISEFNLDDYTMFKLSLLKRYRKLIDEINRITKERYENGS